MNNIDFLNVKKIFQYLLSFTLVLIGGLIGKDVFVILFIALILCLSISKFHYRSLELLLIWLFVYDFFCSQGYINYDFVSKYIAKPYFLIFVIFLTSLNKIPTRILNVKYIYFWFLFLFISFLGSITQNQSPFVFISLSSFFLIYAIFQRKEIKSIQLQNYLNLFVATAILQTIVSLLQVIDIIPPGVKLMEDGFGGQFEFIANLDDVASGTFGVGSSHLTSWFAALITTFLLILWGITRKTTYLVFSAISFMQFAFVDSKLIMGVTVLMLIYLIFYLIKEKFVFQISINKLLLFITIISLGGLGFYKAWNSYYEYYGNKTGGLRTNLSAVYDNEVKNSKNLIIANLGDWGKIRGYQYIIEDYILHDPKQLIWGYGNQGYNFNGKMNEIENKDTPIMKLNNSTNSRSGLITQFATSGLIGFIFFISSIYQWYKYNRRRINNKYDLICNSLLKVYFSFSFLVAFIYSVSLISIPLIAFAALISIHIKLSDQNQLNHSFN